MRQLRLGAARRRTAAARGTCRIAHPGHRARPGRTAPDTDEPQDPAARDPGHGRLDQPVWLPVPAGPAGTGRPHGISAQSGSSRRSGARERGVLEMTADRPRLLLAAPPFSGHLNPLIAMAKRLREHGYDPRFVTGPARVELIRSLGFHADPVLRHDPQAFERIADTAGPIRGNPVRLGRQLAANLALLPAVSRELTDIVERDRPCLVLADFTAPVAGLVAQAASIGWITVMPSPFVLETRTGTPAYCGGWGPPEHAGHRARDAAGRAMTRLVKRGFGVIF